MKSWLVSDFRIKVKVLTLLQLIPTVPPGRGFRPERQLGLRGVSQEQEDAERRLYCMRRTIWQQGEVSIVLTIASHVHIHHRRVFSAC